MIQVKTLVHLANKPSSKSNMHSKKSNFMKTNRTIYRPFQAILLACSYFVLVGCGGKEAVKTPIDTPAPTIIKDKLKPWEHGKLQVKGRMLEHEDKKGFFWMADTAWMMIHRLTKDEMVTYLEDRSKKGFNVILTTAQHYSGLENREHKQAFEQYSTTSPNGTEVNENNISKPNEEYWKHVDFLFDEAAKRGIYIGLLPTWNRIDLNKKGTVLRYEKDAQAYGEFLAKRYKNRQNLIWIIGGDSNPDIPKEDTERRTSIWTTLAKSIKAIDKDHLMSYHTAGQASSTDYFLDETWLDFHMMQTGHCLDEGRIEAINDFFTSKYNTTSLPILDAEPRYEHIIRCPKWGSSTEEQVAKNGRYTAGEVRENAYRVLFLGAFGHTYGHQAIWQMWSKGLEPKNLGGGTTDKSWQDSLDYPGAKQMGYVAKLFRSRHISSRVPDQSIVKSANGMATRGVNYLFVYLPKGGAVTVDLSKISGESLQSWWFNPRTGTATKGETYARTTGKEFTAPDNKDWVLVIDDTKSGYGAPGQ